MGLLQEGATLTLNKNPHSIIDPSLLLKEGLEIEQYNLSRKILLDLNLAKYSGVDSDKWELAREQINNYLSKLEEYQLVLLAHWITSYHTDNKMWYGLIYGLILHKLNSLYVATEKDPLQIESNRQFIKSKIEKAKQLILCEDVARENGIKLDKRGQNLVGLCPFHKENTPSFFIFPDNRYKCFGCNKFGDSIALLDFFNKEK